MAPVFASDRTAGFASTVASDVHRLDIPSGRAFTVLAALRHFRLSVLASSASPPLHYGAAFCTPAFSSPAFLTIPRFSCLRFSSPVSVSQLVGQ